MEKVKKSSLINRAQVKKYIKARIQSDRPGWDCTNVSAEALDQIDAFLRTSIQKAVHGHPTIGKTFKAFF